MVKYKSQYALDYILLLYIMMPTVKGMTAYIENYRTYLIYTCKYNIIFLKTTIIQLMV